MAHFFILWNPRNIPMQEKMNKILAFTLPLLLAACGGGGGGTPAADNNQPQPQPKQPQPQQPAGSYTGVVANVKGEVSATSSNDKYTLTLGGKESYQLPRDVQGAVKQGNILVYGGANGIYKAPDGKSYNSFYVSNDNYRYSKFGLVNPSKGNAGVFYHGIPVPTMPISGKATYTGDAIVAVNGNFANPEIGTVRAAADFGAAKLDISLASTSLKSDIQAKIDGSTFKGSQNGKFVSGSFYGPLAEELSGIYDQEEGKTAAIFGAKR